MREKKIEPVVVENSFTEASTTSATVSANVTPQKGGNIRQRWKEKDSEIHTSHDIKMVPRDMDAFDNTISGNRDEFAAKVKEMCVDRDFRVRIPYADRFDRDGLL